MAQRQRDVKWLARKFIYGLVVTLLAFLAFRSTHISGTTVLGYGSKSTMQLIVLGTPYHTIENASADEIAVMQSQLQYSHLATVYIWAVAIAVICLRRQPASRMSTSPQSSPE